MLNLSDVKYRIKGISQTRQITSAMETISVSKMRRALQKYDANKVYFDKIRATIKNIVYHTTCVTHRYLEKKGGERAVYVVIASDKGLAGGYNHNVLNAAWKDMQVKKERYIFTVGQVAREFFEYRKIAVDGEFTHLTHDPTIYDATDIVDSIVALYDQGMMDEVYIVYTAMESASAVVPRTVKLLPLVREEVVADIEDDKTKTEDYFRELEYDPSPDVVLDYLVPQYLTGVVYGALVQAVACEQSSRRLAMTNATKNATKIIDKLNVVYNRARQEAVTNELTEIITSSMGVADS